MIQKQPLRSANGDGGVGLMKSMNAFIEKKRENTFCMEKEVQNLNIGNRLELIGGVAQNE